MTGVVLLNPATVDGYGNPISLTRDGDVNRLLASSIVEGSPSFRLFDANSNPVDIILEGNSISLGVKDTEQNDLLHGILRELKRMNKYMHYLVEERVDDEDLED